MNSHVGVAYAADIVHRATQGDWQVLVVELDAAFAEAFAANGSPSAEAMAFRELVRFARQEDVRPWLTNEPAALRRVQRFALQAGLDRLAAVLDDSLAGRVQQPLTAIVTGNGYIEAGIDAVVPADAASIRATKAGWDATNLAIEVQLAAFSRSVVQAFVETRGTLGIPAPRSRTRRRAAEARVAAALQPGETAAQLFSRLLQGRNPRVLAVSPEAFDAGDIAGAQTLSTTHRTAAGANAAELRAIRDRVGPAVDDLLAVYAMHDGAELFVVDDEPGFVLAPLSEWDELTANAVEWALTQLSDPEEVPAWLPSAIAFAMIPGDADQWLLITAGAHAGGVTVADSDVLIDDAPLFPTAAAFFACLLVDAPRVLGRGGHVKYAGGELFPIGYLAD